MAVKHHTVTFLPENKSIKVEHLKTIFETIGEENPERVQLYFSCGAEGICQKCKVRSLQQMGPLTPTEKGCLSDQELARGIRLACQARVVQDSQVEIRYKRPFTIELVDEVVRENTDPRLRKIVVAVAAGGRPDAAAIAAAAADAGLAISTEAIAGTLPACLERYRPDNCTVCTTVFLADRLIEVEAGDTSAALYAAAVDLGVNTLVVSLIDIPAAKTIAVVSDTNPQIELGDNYESRIARIDEDELNLEILNEEILLRTDILIYELCVARNISPLQVYEIIVTGGTGMLHLFLERAPGPLEQSAVPGADGQCGYTSGQLELRSPERAHVALLPAISAYAGADITAAILAARLHRSRATTLLVDLGSSTKAVLYTEGRLVAASIRNTEAFEGAGLSCGMRPETGAIAQVTVDGDITVSVIGESLARGICGSGLLGLAAGLKACGLMDAAGNLAAGGAGCSTALQQRLITVDGRPAVLLYHDTGAFATDVYVTQHDIFRLRAARARAVAMLAELCAHAGIGLADVQHVLVSGALGGTLDAGVFTGLGFLPEALQDRITFIGNASRQGAQLALLDKTLLEEAERLVNAVECIPTSNREPEAGELHF